MTRGLGTGVPHFEQAIGVPLRDEPGTTFTYSGIPLQVFGALLARKLAARKQTPLEYLQQRIFDPIGLEIGSWRTLADGSSTMPTGAFLSARNWAKFGMLIAAGGRWNAQCLLSRQSIEECLTPSSINPRYGLGFWLDPLAGKGPHVVYASGSGKQALYVIPEQYLVAVHFSRSTNYRHERFLHLLTKV